VQRQRGLAARLRPEHLHHAPAGQPADAEGHIQRRGAGGDHFDRLVRPLAQPHHGAFAELPLNLRESGVERLLAVRTCHGCHPVRLIRSLHIHGR
jgi:hypothetical protein